jgi:hypothetical protein
VDPERLAAALTAEQERFGRDADRHTEVFGEALSELVGPAAT